MILRVTGSSNLIGEAVAAVMVSRCEPIAPEVSITQGGARYCYQHHVMRAALCYNLCAFG
jgi:hypothetical protein